MTVTLDFKAIVLTILIKSKAVLMPESKYPKNIHECLVAVYDESCPSNAFE